MAITKLNHYGEVQQFIASILQAQRARLGWGASQKFLGNSELRRFRQRQCASRQGSFGLTHAYPCQREICSVESDPLPTGRQRDSL